MSHKAISTFVAAVILVAFTISAAIIVTSFLTGVIKFQTTSVSSQAVCAQKGAILIDTAMCTRVRDSSLVGYWKLDSVNNTNYTADSSGYGNDGRLYNGSTSCFNLTGCINLTTGQIGNAMLFDGADDYVDAGNAASLNITDAITIEAWIKPLSSGWTKKKPITITGSTSALTDYQVKITVLYDSDMQTDFDDLRFTDINGNILSYWIENYTISTNATVWVKVPSIPTSGTTIYMYYGNPSAASASNGTNTFLFFDDFEYQDSDADTALWTPRYEYGSSGGSADIGTSVSGKLKVYETKGANAWYAVQGDGQQLPQDFIAQVDWSEPYTYPDSAAISFEVRDTSQLTGKTGFVEISRSYYYTGPGVNGIHMSQDDANFYSVATTATSGKFRLRRLGNTIYGDYDIGGGWVTLGSYTISYDTYIAFAAKTWSYEQESPADGRWDNIRVRKYASPEPSATLGNETAAGISKSGAYGIGASTTTAFASINNQTISGTISSGWNHIVQTYNGSYQKLFVNGNLVTSAALTGAITTNSNNLLIGDLIAFNGTIDDVRIYNRSLSADEIQQHYQKGLEKFAVDGYFKTIKAAVRNIGTTPLANFTVFADINGKFYLNNTPQNGGATLPAASEPLTLQAYTYYDGPIRTLKVSVLNCPISMTMTNDSGVVGVC